MAALKGKIDFTPSSSLLGAAAAAQSQGKIGEPVAKGTTQLLSPATSSGPRPAGPCNLHAARAWCFTEGCPLCQNHSHDGCCPEHCCDW